MKAGETADGRLIKRYTDWVEMKLCYDHLFQLNSALYPTISQFWFCWNVVLSPVALPVAAVRENTPLVASECGAYW